MIRTVELTKKNRSNLLVNLVGLSTSLNKAAFADVNGPHKLNNASVMMDGKVFHLFDQFANPQQGFDEKTKYLLVWAKDVLVPLIVEEYDSENKVIHYSMSRVRFDCEDKIKVELSRIKELLLIPERLDETFITLSDEERSAEIESTLMDRYSRVAVNN